MKFDPKYFEKNPVEMFDNKTGRPLPSFTKLFHTYSLKQEPKISVEQAHGLLRDKSAFDKLSLVDRVGIEQVIAHNQADRLGIPHPKVRIVPNISIASQLIQGLANGNSIYLNSNTLKSNEWSHNTPVHETSHLYQFAAERGDVQPDEALRQSKSLYQKNAKDIFLHPIKFVLAHYASDREQDARNRANAYQKEYNLPGDFEEYEKKQAKGINFEKKYGDGWGAIAKGVYKVSARNLKHMVPIAKMKGKAIKFISIKKSVRQQVSHMRLNNLNREQSRNLNIYKNKSL